MSERDPAARLLAFVDRLKERGEREEEAPEELEDWIVIGVAGRAFALPIGEVREVVRVEGLRRIAGAPFPVRGAINLRGRVLAVVDLGERLGLGPVELDRDSRVVVVELAERRVGLLVERATRIAQIAPSGVRPAEPDLLPAGGEAVRGLAADGKDRLILLAGDGLVVTETPG